MGKSPFRPSNALLCTTNPPRNTDFHVARKRSRVGALTYLRVLNIASFAVGISFAILATNWVYSSFVALPYSDIIEAATAVFATPVFDLVLFPNVALSA